MEIKRTKTPEQALRTLMESCAKSERATSDIRKSLIRWGISEDQQAKIIHTLVEHKFIDDQRYTEAYVREKVNLSRWGTYKIRAALRAKQIPDTTIDRALEQVDPIAWRDKLELQLRRKQQSIKARNTYELRGKLMRYGAALGFDFDTVHELVDRLVRDDE